MTVRCALCGRPLYDTGDYTMAVTPATCQPTCVELTQQLTELADMALKSPDVHEVVQRMHERRGRGQQWEALNAEITGAWQHTEAFCLMLYRCRICRAMEVLWNSRDGVTPFSIPCRDDACNRQEVCPMLHDEWRLDTRMPTFRPWPGMRIFRDGTDDEVRAMTRARLAQARGTELEVPESQWTAIVDSAVANRPKGWPQIEVRT